MTHARVHNPTADRRYRITSPAGVSLAREKIQELTKQERTATRKPDRRAALICRWARWVLQAVVDAGVVGMTRERLMVYVEETYGRTPPDDQVMDKIMKLVHRDLKETEAVDAEQRKLKEQGAATIVPMPLKKPAQSSYSSSRDRLNQVRLK